MSLIVNLATLAEGIGSDSRGALTLIAANPQSFIADQLPAQFAPFFLVYIEEDGEPETSIIVPGHGVSFRLQVTDPENNVIFYSQLQQNVPPVAHPSVPPRVQLIAQIPFTAQKGGRYEVSAHIVLQSVNGRDESVDAARTVLVMDVATFRGEAN